MDKQFKLDLVGEHALNQLQNTALTPMEEALFKSWAVANQIEKPDSADNLIDYRGLYKSVGGKVLPYGLLKGMTDRKNNEEKLVRVLRERAMDKMQQAGDQEQKVHDEWRQDVKHKQRMESDGMQLAKMPYELQKQRITAQTKQYDVQGKQAQAEAQKHKTDGTLFNAMLQAYKPEPVAAPAPTETTEETGSIE